MHWRESTLNGSDPDGPSVDRAVWHLEQDDGISLAMVTDQYEKWTAFIGNICLIFPTLEEAKAWCEVTCRMEGHT